MRLEGSADARRLAKRLRKELTAPEIGLWLALRRNDAGLRFRRQYAAGVYVLDFYCAPAKLAVEVDGEAHGRGDQPERDARRDQSLGKQGVRVLRYTAKDVLTNLEGVMRQVMTIAVRHRDRLEAGRLPPPPSPVATPPPCGGG